MPVDSSVLQIWIVILLVKFNIEDRDSIIIIINWKG